MRCSHSYADGKIVATSHSETPDGEEGQVGNMLSKGPVHHKHGASARPRGFAHASHANAAAGKVSQDHFADAQHTPHQGMGNPFAGASEGPSQNFADGGGVGEVWDSVKASVKHTLGLDRAKSTDTNTGSGTGTPAPSTPTRQLTHGGKTYDDIVNQAETGKE